MSDAGILNLVLFLPLIGAALLVVVPRDNGALVRGVSLAVMVVQLVLTAWLYSRFDSTVAGLQFETRLPWIAAWGVSYQIGLDGYNILLVMMTAFLGPLVVAGAFTAIAKDVKLFYAMVFLVQFAMMGTFLAQDLFLFYVFWETMLIPMFLLIGIWGGERRIYATIKFVLYTAFGSILMLAAVIYLVWSLHKTTGITSFAFSDLMQTRLPLDVQSILLAAFALSFAIKVPMAPLHTWLPDAHVEAPTAGSVILAGVMLKMGTYGFMKLGFPLFPDATQLYTPVLMALAVLSIVYGACLALVQDDIKKIIAYSSISHLGYVMLGLLSLELIGIQGAVIQMVSHGLVAGGLFLMVGMIYERCHTRELKAYGGLAKLLPVYSVFFMILTLASVGLPTTSGFTGEFLVLLGAFKAAWPLHLAGNDLPLALAAVAVAGVVLGALYMLRFALGFLYGQARAPHQPLLDLGRREKAILGLIVAAVFALGLFPDGPMQKTELAAKSYRALVATPRLVAKAP
jgi:NADH-quinone oxidoreductase subunit M